SKEVLLPCPGRSSSLKTSYRNGILEIVLAKAGKGR
ncbi:MAG: Hsp20/alpha crystallin family protein, partial [Deltaproteobacteria bacterium]|nr:Hsp20/alpha crystallin family protein [Deltaproteobacteria bacterium]